MKKKSLRHSNHILFKLLNYCTMFTLTSLGRCEIPHSVFFPRHLFDFVSYHTPPSWGFPNALLTQKSLCPCSSFSLTFLFQTTAQFLPSPPFRFCASVIFSARSCSRPELKLYLTHRHSYSPCVLLVFSTALLLSYYQYSPH